MNTRDQRIGTQHCRVAVRWIVERRIVSKAKTVRRVTHWREALCDQIKLTAPAHAVAS
jgi:hypothetical protein